MNIACASSLVFLFFPFAFVSCFCFPLSAPPPLVLWERALSASPRLNSCPKGASTRLLVWFLRCSLVDRPRGGDLRWLVDDTRITAGARTALTRATALGSLQTFCSICGGVLWSTTFHTFVEEEEEEEERSGWPGRVSRPGLGIRVPSRTR